MKDNGKLIFYADDFGLLPQGDEAILELLAAGCLQGTSVLLAGLTDPELQKLKALKQARGIKIGLHLDARRILDKAGGIADEERLSFILISGWRLIFSRALREEVRAAWRSQIEEFKRRFGFYPDQLEAHQHLNFHPFLFGDICHLAQEHRIAGVRGGRRVAPIKFWARSPKAVMINALLTWDRLFTRGRRYGFLTHTTDSIISLDWIFPRFDAETVQKMLSEVYGQRVEIIFHPAKRIMDQRDYEILRERYQQYDFLKNIN